MLIEVKREGNMFVSEAEGYVCLFDKKSSEPRKNSTNVMVVGCKYDDSEHDFLKPSALLVSEILSCHLSVAHGGFKLDEYGEPVTTVQGKVLKANRLSKVISMDRGIVIVNREAFLSGKKVLKIEGVPDCSHLRVEKRK